MRISRWITLAVVVVAVAAVSASGALGGSAAAIEAMKLGAYDYITKPFDLDEVLFTVRRAITQKTLIAQVKALATIQPSGSDDAKDDELVGRSPPMLQVFKTIGRVASTQEPVLILGESDRSGEPRIHRRSGVDHEHDRDHIAVLKRDAHLAVAGQRLADELIRLAAEATERRYGRD